MEVIWCPVVSLTDVKCFYSLDLIPFLRRIYCRFTTFHIRAAINDCKMKSVDRSV